MQGVAWRVHSVIRTPESSAFFVSRHQPNFRYLAVQDDCTSSLSVPGSGWGREAGAEVGWKAHLPCEPSFFFFSPLKNSFLEAPSWLPKMVGNVIF